MANAKPSIIMALDQTASVLVASDITRRVSELNCENIPYPLVLNIGAL